jgi:hypothetical protein
VSAGSTGAVRSAMRGPTGWPAKPSLPTSREDRQVSESISAVFGSGVTEFAANCECDGHPDVHLRLGEPVVRSLGGYGLWPSEDGSLVPTGILFSGFDYITYCNGSRTGFRRSGGCVRA